MRSVVPAERSGKVVAMSIYEVWNRELDGGLTVVTDKQVEAVRTVLAREEQSTITLRLGVYCLKTTHRPIACGYCDRASIIHWGGEFLCREHWEKTTIRDDDGIEHHGSRGVS